VSSVENCRSFQTVCFHTFIFISILLFYMTTTFLSHETGITLERTCCRRTSVDQ
jgi:hypothetical protein